MELPTLLSPLTTDESTGNEFSRHGHTTLDGLDIPVPQNHFDSLLSGEGGGSRRVPADHDLIALLLGQPAIHKLVSGLLGPGARPVRAIAFDKTAGRNWLVPWHQDRTIAVDRRDEAADVRCWTVKNGVNHCEPPVGLLERMVTLRWHLDAVGPRDGCIRVLPGSHRLGRLKAVDIHDLLDEVPAALVSAIKSHLFFKNILCSMRPSIRAISILAAASLLMGRNSPN